MTIKQTLLLVPALALTLAFAACDNKAEDTTAPVDTNQTSMINDLPSVAPAAGDEETTTSSDASAADAVASSDAAVAPAGEAGVSEASPAEGVTEALPAPVDDTTACPHQDLVGKTKGDIDMSTIKEPVRVLYPDSPATMDYNANRVNIILEHGTDKVTEVRCG